jgi:hypothetical protein
VTRWLEAANQELIALADIDPPTSGKIAGNLYQLAYRLDATRVEALVRLPTKVAEIRYWDQGQYAIYFRVDGNNAYTVLHIGKVIGALRVQSDGIATRRARDRS